MAGLLSNAISGLQVSQNALRTAGHNISNANTEGYNRQRTDNIARPAERLGAAGYVGGGASTQSVERMVDQFVNTQLRTDTTNFNALDKYNTNIGKIGILHIHPTVSEVREQTKTFTVDSGDEGTFSLPLAFSSVRESDSIIRARNGQVVVIGGLMKDNTQEDRIGTPGLSRIPFIGDLFGSRQETSTKTELVILLRPIVIGTGDAWAEQVQEPLNRVRSMTGGTNR